MSRARTAKLIVVGSALIASFGCATGGSAAATPTLFVPPTLPPSMAQATPITPSPTPPPATIDPNIPTPTALTGGGNGQATPLPPGAEYASVTFVIDGDTIDVSIGGTPYRVRYIGINTPERDQPCYTEATNANRALVEDQIVVLAKDVSETDQYGRLLRYIYVGNTFVNGELVRAGWAEARRYEPDTSEYDFLNDLEGQAAQNNLGCWPTGVFER